MECPICKGKMEKIVDEIKQDKVGFEAFKCSSCGEELVNMKQLKELSDKYRELRKSKETIFAKWGNSLAVRILCYPETARHLKTARHF
ncbi:hypothetical protein HZA97_09520 [Candidatus Woesearchaeota archaeon]|nr:hypothetical protein [Candidatus Woesearchaeota archaeon]